MTERRLLLIGDITQRMRSRLSAGFEIVELFKQADRGQFLASQGPSFEAVLTDGHWGVPADVADSLPNLRIVSSYGVGYDAIDAAYFADRHIVVTHTPDVLNDEVAVTALMLWFAVSRRLVQADHWARSGAWEDKGAFPLTQSVMGRRVGVLGLGRIGLTFAKRAEAFGAEIIYHARSEKDVAYQYYTDLVEMSGKSDVLVVTTPGGSGTRHLVNADVLRALGPEGILVNVGRGSVVDEAALVDALSSNALGGAGLDVFEDEPRIPDALKSMENVVLTPHVGSATHDTRRAMGDLVCQNLEVFFQSGKAVTPIPECAHLAG